MAVNIGCTIGGSAQSTLRAELSLTQMIGERDVAVVRLLNSRPAVPSALTLSIDEVLKFGGNILKTNETGEGAHSFTRVTATGYEQVLDKVIVTETYEVGQTLKAVLTDLRTKYLLTHGFSYPVGMGDGPTLTKQEWKNQKMGDIFRSLMKQTATVYRSSPTKVLTWETAGTSVAPQAITDADAVGGISVDRDATDYANHVIVLAGDPSDPIVGEASDAGEIADHGQYDAIYEAPNVWDVGTADALAAEILLIRKNTVVQVGFTTRIPGFTAGQRVALSSTRRGLVAADYLIQEVRVTGNENELFYAVSATSLLHAMESYLDKYRQWSPGSTITAIPGGGSSLGLTVYTLAADQLTGVRATPAAWVEVGNSFPALLDGSLWSGRTVTAYVRFRALTEGVQVTPRIWNKTAGAVAAVGAAATGPWWSGETELWSSWQALPVTVAAGVNEYALQLLPGTAGEYVHGQARVECR